MFSEQEVVFTVDMLMRLKRVREVHVSHDGNFIAYTLQIRRDVYNDDDGHPWSELHVVDMQGHSRPFITGKVNVSELDWSADAKGIYFLAKRHDDEHKSLYHIPIDGGEAQKILAYQTDIENYTWSPDSQWVAFVAKEKIDEDLKKDREHGFNAEIFEEDWQDHKLWIAGPDFEKPLLSKANKNLPREIAITGSASMLQWSPDGKFLAVAIAPTPSVDDSYMKRRIHIIDAASGEVVSIIDTKGKLDWFSWNPDSKSLALLAGLDEHDPSAGRLMVASLTDPQPQVLLPDFPGHINDLTWLNEKEIVYLADQGVYSLIETIRKTGARNKTLLPAKDHVLYTLSISDDGNVMAFAGDSPTHPTEVYLMTATDTAPRRLTHSNPWLADVKLARQEVIRFPARDGLEIEGMLLHPLEETPQTRYPLIMMVHGGPEAHHRNGWLTRPGYPGQLAAAQGYAVFYTNYRGSTGRGLAFAKLSQADPAGKEFDDLVDAIGHLDQLGLIDKTKVGITGGSYGGYASAWGATAHSQHYAASVMYVGLSDMFMSFSLSDIPEELRLVHFLEYPWERWDFYLERSPIKHFQKCRTPLLIMHGKDDTRVHPANSKALFRMIKTYGQSPVRLVLYPGEGHGNRRAGSQVEFTLRQMRWFDHYLKGPGGQMPPYELDLSDYRPKEEDENDS